VYVAQSRPLPRVLVFLSETFFVLPSAGLVLHNRGLPSTNRLTSVRPCLKLPFLFFNMVNAFEIFPLYSFPTLSLFCALSPQSASFNMSGTPRLAPLRACPLLRPISSTAGGFRGRWGSPFSMPPDGTKILRFPPPALGSRQLLNGCPSTTRLLVPVALTRPCDTCSSSLHPPTPAGRFLSIIQS